MSSSDAAALLVRALEAAVTGDHTIVEEVFTEDVVGWSPNLSVTSRAELVRSPGRPRRGPGRRRGQRDLLRPR